MQDRKFQLREVARMINAGINPDSGGEELVYGFTTLEAAGPGDLSFASSDKYLSQARESKAKALVVPKEVSLEGKTLLQVDDVWKAVLTLLSHFYPEPKPSGEIHPSALVSEEAQVGKQVTIGPLSVIEPGASIDDHTIVGPLNYIGRNVRIGATCLLHPRVTILKDCIIGDRVIIHPGAVIGSDGFKFENIGGIPTKIPQVGRVVIEDDADIGANTCIDRASFTDTRIGRGTKLDNLVQVGHNVETGPYCLMAGQVGIAGSVKIGSGCIFGGQAGIKDNIIIGDRVMVGGQSGVRKSVSSNEKLFGSPAKPVKELAKQELHLKSIPGLQKKLKLLEDKIEQLEKRTGEEK